MLRGCIGLAAALAGLAFGAVGSAGCTDLGPELAPTEVARRGTRATAYLEVAPGRTATAFCVHPSGLFVTIGRVFEGRTSGEGPTRLIVGPGTLDQKIYPARRVRLDPASGLALLKAEGAEGLDYVELGAPEGLVELADLYMFGFPIGQGVGFGRVPDGATLPYPSITVGRGPITSIHRRDGRIERLQVNAMMLPGNLGGPLLDVRGRLAGVVVGRYEHPSASGDNFAIPVGELGRFLARPDVELAAPAPGAGLKVGEEVEFRAAVSSPIPDVRPPDLHLEFSSVGTVGRRVPMALTEGVYTARTVPFPEAKEPEKVLVAVDYGDGSVRGLARDVALRSGDGELKLSRLRSLQVAPSREARAADGRRLDAPPELPGRLELSVGGQALSLDLSSARRLDVVETEDLGALNCAVIATRDGAEVGRLDVPLYLDDAPRPSFDALRDGRFVRPARSAGPISRVRVESSPGDPLGEGKTYEFAPEDLTFAHGGNRVSVVLREPPEGPWSIEFQTAANRPLAVGEYRDARQPYASPTSAAIEANFQGRATRGLVGGFRVWELEVQDQRVVRLAIDFELRAEGSLPPVVGTIRLNSRFH